MTGLKGCDGESHLAVESNTEGLKQRQRRDCGKLWPLVLKKDSGDIAAVYRARE